MFLLGSTGVKTERVQSININTQMHVYRFVSAPITHKILHKGQVLQL